VNNITSVSERRQRKSDKSDKIICEKPNLNTSNKNIHGIYVNTEINVGEKSYCNGESDFTHDRNIVLCGFINKNTNYKHGGGDIYLCENSLNKRVIVRNLVIKRCKCAHTADTMASNITRSRAHDDNNHFVYGLRSFGKGRDVISYVQ
jgi:hypothetical protein